MATVEDQQFCLRWNNFQANITSQFETLRDDEDFVDVTLACEGQRLEAHKVVLSACSPFFKELFKSNPCPHPIIFMRDVEARHVVALLEFMYAGEVNVAQAQLSGFLRTAESLQIRGLTDASKVQKDGSKCQKENETPKQQYLNEIPATCNTKSTTNYTNATSNKPNTYNSQSKKSQSPRPKSRSRSPPGVVAGGGSSSTLRTSVDRKAEKSNARSMVDSPIPLKKHCKTESQPNAESEKETETDKSNIEMTPSPASTSNSNNINPFSGMHTTDIHSELDLASDMIEPKIEPDYPSDDENMRSDSRMDESILGFDTSDLGNAFGGIHGGMEILPGTSMGDLSQDSNQALSDSRKLHSLDPRPCHLCGRVYSNLSNLRQHMRLIHHPQTVACPICGKQFKTKLYMKRHLVIYHHGDLRASKATGQQSLETKQSNAPPPNDSLQRNMSHVNAEHKQPLYGKNHDCVAVTSPANLSPYNSYRLTHNNTQPQDNFGCQPTPPPAIQPMLDTSYISKEYTTNQVAEYNHN